MKKLLFIALVAGGLTFAAVPRSDAGVYFSIGFGPGYYGYYPYGYYYPYRYQYYRPPTTGTADTVIFIAPIATTIITDIKVTQDLEIRLSWLESNFEPAAF